MTNSNPKIFSIFEIVNPQSKAHGKRGNMWQGSGPLFEDITKAGVRSHDHRRVCLRTARRLIWDLGSGGPTALQQSFSGEMSLGWNMKNAKGGAVTACLPFRRGDILVRVSG